MIIQNVVYLLRTYFKSSFWFLPCLLFFLFLCLNYSYKPNPVADSYSVTAVFLFFIACWVGRGVCHAEHPEQRAISLTHTPHRWQYYLSEWLTAVAIISMLAILTVLFPVFMGVLERFPSSIEWLIAITGHIALGILGSSLALLTQRSFIHKTNYGFSILAIWSFSGLLHKKLLTGLPESVYFIKWILPPVLPLTEQMMTADSVESVLGLSFYAVTYAFILVLLYIFFSVMKKDVL